VEWPGIEPGSRLRHSTAEGRISPKLYIKIQSVPRSKHTISVIQTSQLMLYREIIAVCSQIHTNPLCGRTQNVPRQPWRYTQLSLPHPHPALTWNRRYPLSYIQYSGSSWPLADFLCSDSRVTFCSWMARHRCRINRHLDPPAGGPGAPPTAGLRPLIAASPVSHRVRPVTNKM